MSEEIKAKIRLSKKGKVNGREGYKHSEETKAKMKKAAEGRNVSHLNWTGKTHTEESRKKISEANYRRLQKPEDHPRWIADRTKVKKYHNKKADTEYKQWMLKVKRRDRWTCQLNSSECSGNLEAHHIFNWCDYPTLRYSLKNGITLCRQHHPRGRVKEEELRFTLLGIINKIEAHLTSG